jgi:hypothetical protein
MRKSHWFVQGTRAAWLFSPRWRHCTQTYAYMHDAGAEVGKMQGNSKGTSAPDTESWKLTVRGAAPTATDCCSVIVGFGGRDGLVCLHQQWKSTAGCVSRLDCDTHMSLGLRKHFAFSCSAHLQTMCSRCQKMIAWPTGVLLPT